MMCDLLRCHDHSLKLLPVCFHAVGRDAHYGGSVEIYQQFLATVVLLEHSQEVKTLLCLLDYGPSFSRPGQVKERTLSTELLLMERGDRSDMRFLKSRMVSFVFVVFRARLLSAHHADSCWTSSL